MAKKKRKELPVADKLQQTKQGQALLGKVLCPSCRGYNSMGGDYLYHCKLLGRDKINLWEVRRGLGGSYPIVSNTPCTIARALTCLLSGLVSVVSNDTEVT